MTPTIRESSLAKGAAGIALLHIERAAAGRGTWEAAHTWLTRCVEGGLSTSPTTGLFYGAPAAAFAVHTAAIHTGRYQGTLDTIHAAVTETTKRRLDTAHARIDRGERPDFFEFDLIYGLTGLGTYFLRSSPDGDTTRRILVYLTRLTKPLPDSTPGWWTGLAPSGQPSPDYPGGHANFGMAHGITGPLALLALAWRAGITVPGHLDAIARICTWLDTWRQDSDHGLWWPEVITPAEAATGTTRQQRPLRPSWCYGTPGIARAQQLAAIATRDPVRQHIAEAALLACLTEPEQHSQITDHTLCHGSAGLFQAAWRTATDSSTPTIREHLASLGDQIPDTSPPDSEPGLLEGAAGVALARHTASTGTITDWDACLLLA
ncbi:lanthionine synthetase C family protein [Streptomyces sp. UNOC14_S4]|uniref:lanthionine synthetase C family protein n=1 Tax=Streptomyces sp. UNOC14_S4 TaxID=2872340 RepID=UPI001E36F1BF|nr:lanthionine synthetase C family protein [Streptomyces sp. UNOC14_S4]MCC3767573.1 lanthionine synthetase C family protein [Streptomyces sp. UNOC14_S4]